MSRWMISPSCDGKQALIIHSDLRREPQHSARRSPVEVTNWSGLGVHRKSHLLTWIPEMCWWVQNYTFLQCIWARMCTANARVTLPGCGKESCQIRAEWNIFKPKQTEIFFWDGFKCSVKGDKQSVVWEDLLSHKDNQLVMASACKSI